MTVPSDIFLYLFTIAAIISVPPVEPPAIKQQPNPAPSKIAPIRHAINNSSPTNFGLPKYSCVRCTNHSMKESVSTAKMVFMQNFQPNSFTAITRSAILIIRYVFWTSKPLV